MSGDSGTDKIPLVVICGPTASGKTALAVELAKRYSCEVVSADSRQVYREMDIGTAKASAEEQALVRHHLIDLVAPDGAFSAADFEQRGRAAVAEIFGRGHLPLLVGGTGLYIRVLTEGLLDAPGADPRLRQELLDQEAREGEGTLYRQLRQVDPVLAERLSPRDLIRIVRALEVACLSGRPLSALQEAHGFAQRPFRTLRIGLVPQREELHRRIDERVEKMLEAGLLDEVRLLLEQGYSPQLKSMQTIGYRECLRHLEGSLSLEEAIALIQRETRRYAKRQLTWFRRDKSIIWVDYSRESAKILSLIDHFYAA